MNQRRPPELTIDRLDLRLPAGFAHRADAIAREAAHQLARLPLPAGADPRLASIAPPAVRIHGGESNRIIAQRIAHGISQQLRPAHNPSRRT